MHTADFFSVVLPTTGLVCIAVPSQHGFLHRFYADTEAAAEVAAHYDARGDVAVYYACASYRSDVNRKGSNVAAVRSFWLDLDCGAGKPYLTQADAVRSLAQFIKQLKLPRPYVINSGRGLHAYWPMDQDMSPEVWRAVAQKLKQATRELGLKVDQSRTADIASVMRPVGTHHRKGEVKLVSVLSPGVISSLNKFTQLLAGFNNPLPNSLKNSNLEINNDLATGLYHAEAQANSIADECAIIHLLRDTRGNVDQATWYAAIGVVAFCEAGPAWVHEWSTGHPGYQTDNPYVQQKIDQVLKFKPTTCAKLEDTQAELCAACPHHGHLVSPIKLGYPSKGSEPEKLMALAPEPRVALPEGYSYQTDSANSSKHILLLALKNDAGVFLPTPVCNTLFYPLQRIATEHGNQLEFEMRRRAGERKTFTLDCSTIAEGGRALASELGKHEIVAMPFMRPKVEAYLTKFMDVMKERALEIKTHCRFGWHNDNFLLGTTLLTPQGCREVVLDGNAAIKAQAFARRGEYSVWKEVINEAYNYPGQEALQYLIVIAFAAPLFSMFREYGGVTVYAHSQGSGVGKTTAQRAGLSAWGNWQQLQLADGRVTLNALYELIGTYCNLPVVFDELTNMDNKIASDVVYCISEGHPRERLHPDGSIKVNKTFWSTIVMASGNSMLTEKLELNRSNAEAEISRTFEFTVYNHSTLSTQQARQLFPKLSDHYGHAGLEFIDYVTKNYTKVKAVLLAMQQSFDAKTQVSSVERYWSALQAAVMTALRLCNNLKILSFPEDRLREWIIDQVDSNRAQRDGAANTPLEVFGRMLNDIWTGVLVTKGEGDVRRNLFADVLMTPKSALTGRIILAMDKTERDVLLLSQAAVKEWCSKHGASAKEVFDAVVERGWAHATLERYSLGKGTSGFSGMTSQMNCWMMDLRKMGAESHDRMVAQRVRLIANPEGLPVHEHDAVAAATVPHQHRGSEPALKVSPDSF